jgi:hypothetical protein
MAHGKAVPKTLIRNTLQCLWLWSPGPFRESLGTREKSDSDRPEDVNSNKTAWDPAAKTRYTRSIRSDSSCSANRNLGFVVMGPARLKLRSRCQAEPCFQSRRRRTQSKNQMNGLVAKLSLPVLHLQASEHVNTGSIFCRSGSWREKPGGRDHLHSRDAHRLLAA